MKNNILSLQKKINIKFKNINLLVKSVTHKSFNPLDNYEKLEFLGDRVLGLVISKKLLELYPKENEGILDKTHIRFFTLTEIRLMLDKCGWMETSLNIVRIGLNFFASRNFLKQPVMRDLDFIDNNNYTAADDIHDNGFFVGNGSLPIKDEITKLYEVISNLVK